MQLSAKLTRACILLNLVSGVVYDKHGYPTNDGSILCVGRECFLDAYYVFVACSASALIVSVILCFKKKK